MIAADGRQVWFRVSVRVLLNDQGRPREIRGLMVNISKRKKVERQFYAELSKLSARLEDMAFLQKLSGRLSATLELQLILEEVLAGVMAVQGSEKGVLKLFDLERNELRLAVSSGLPGSVTRFLERVPIGPNLGSCSRVVTEGDPIFIEDVATAAADDHDRETARLGNFRAIYTTPLLNRRREVLGTIASYFEEPHRPPDRQVRLVELFARQAGDFIENARLHRKVLEAARSRELFLAVLAHELRNPLYSIFTSLRLLKLPDLGEAGSTLALSAIERQARHLARLVEDLMDASRIAQGKIVLHKQAVDLIEIVTHAIETARPAIESSEHELSVSMPEVSVRLEADPDRLVQVLVNLLTNAAKYTDRGGRSPSRAQPRGIKSRSGSATPATGFHPKSCLTSSTSSRRGITRPDVRGEGWASGSDSSGAWSSSTVDTSRPQAPGSGTAPSSSSLCRH